MRILQVCSAKGFGGGERHVADLCRGLRELGHEVHLAARPDGELVKAESLAGIEIHPVTIRNSADLKSVIKLRELNKRLDIDIVHAHSGRDYLPAAFSARGLKASFVLTRHHYYPFRVGPFYERLIGNTGILIAVSRAVADGLARSLPELSDRVRVIPNWLPSDLPLNREDARTQLGVTSQLSVGIVGDVVPLKGQRLVAEAIAGLPVELRAGTELVLIGRCDKAEYKADITSVLPETRFLGEVSSAGLLTGGLDILVVASEGEGFSLAAIEGMNAGSAVVCARTPALEELVRHDETGCFFEPGDLPGLRKLLAELLCQPGRRENLGENAKNEVRQRFSRMRILRLIESEYLKLSSASLSSK